MQRASGRRGAIRWVLRINGAGNRCENQGWGMSEVSVADKSLIPMRAIAETDPWTEIRINPRSDIRLAKYIDELPALFGQYYEVRDNGGSKMVGVVDPNGNPVFQFALFIKQKVGGRPVPNMDAPAIFEYHQRMITG